MPKFSIIIPCYNAVHTIDETLCSLVDQSFANWEALCIDDGSCDGTWDVINGYRERDPRIRVLQNPGKGPSAARNFGALDMARADILCFCDADDIWLPGKLQELADGFQNGNVSGIYAKIGFFQVQPGDGQTCSTVLPEALSIPALLCENPVCTLSNFSLRRSAFAQVGGFDPQFSHNEDLDLLVRLIADGVQIIGLDRLQVWYRCSPGGLSSDLVAMERSRQKVLERARRLGVLGTRRAEAVYLRYLARRALRLGSARSDALRLTLRGLLQSPIGFLFPLHRGLGTAIAALVALALPQTLRSTLFS